MSALASPDELLGHHLVYEIDMLRETHGKLPNDHTVLNNALIESFCVHARNLIEFFCKRAKKYTDDNYRPFANVDKNLKAIRVRINVQISHIIYAGRTVKDSEKINDEDRAEILNILSEATADFKAHLSLQYRHITIPDLARVPKGAPKGAATGSIGPTTTTSSTLVITVGPSGAPHCWVFCSWHDWFATTRQVKGLPRRRLIAARRDDQHGRERLDLGQIASGLIFADFDCSRWGFQKPKADQMGRGGRREGAGRPRGSKNRRTIAKVPLLPAQAHRRTIEQMPLDILIAAARDKTQQWAWPGCDERKCRIEGSFKVARLLAVRPCDLQKARPRFSATGSARK
jgi:hypothetical protein